MKTTSESSSIVYDIARGNRAWLRWAKKVKVFLPRGVSAHRIWSGPIKGRKIVTSWRDYPAAILGLTERPLLGWFGQEVGVGETWLDVGAHYGYTALSLSSLVGPQGRVFAFEPMIPTAGYLVKTRAINQLAQLTVVPMGLDEAAALASSEIRTVRGMVDSTLAPDVGLTEWRETMFSASLDWLWPRLCGVRPKIHGIKIDVQGMEIVALRGMQETLRAHRPKLIVEVHQGVSRPELLALLSVVGYRTPGTPVEPVEGEIAPQYLDDRSYAFMPT